MSYSYNDVKNITWQEEVYAAAVARLFDASD